MKSPQAESNAMGESAAYGTPTRSLAPLMWLALAVMMIIVVLSAYLRLSGVGLGCSPWPQCFGQVTESAAHPWARIVHRLAASTLGLLVAGIVAVVLWQRPRSMQRVGIALALLGFTLMLAAIGKWTPHLRLPAVTLANLLGGLAMLALLWRLCLRVPNERRPAFADPGLRRPIRIGLWLLASQLVLGAMVSAYFAGASCIAGTGCEMNWTTVNWAQLNPFDELAVDASARVVVLPIMPVLAMMHRYVGGVALIYLGWLALIALRTTALRRNAVAILGLLIAQAVLGLIAINQGLRLPLAVMHNAVAALLLLSVISLDHRAGLARSIGEDAGQREHQE